MPVLTETQYTTLQDHIMDTIIDEILRFERCRGLTLYQYIAAPGPRPESLAHRLSEEILEAAGIRWEEEFDIMGEHDYLMPDCHP